MKSKNNLKFSTTKIQQIKKSKKQFEKYKSFFFLNEREKNQQIHKKKSKNCQKWSKKIQKSQKLSKNHFFYLFFFFGGGEVFPALKKNAILLVFQ